MSNTPMFENMPAEYQDLLAQLQPDTNAAGRGQSGGYNRLSIRGGVFRKVVDGQEVGELEDRAVKAVVVKTAPITRMYYASKYVEGQTSPLTCWSSDTSTGVPSSDVPEEDRQSKACFDCAQNIKGSGLGEGRACRYQQRVALLLANNDGKIKSKEIYQLPLPATSVFGDNKQKMGLQTYARFLASQEKPVPLAALLTEIRFDTDSSTPKLSFKPLRVLEQDELAVAVELQKAPETEKLITLSVKPKEVSSTPQLTSAKVATPSSLFEQPIEEKAIATAEVIEEPKVKVSKKKKAEPTGDIDLASMLDEFDD